MHNLHLGDMHDDIQCGICNGSPARTHCATRINDDPTQLHSLCCFLADLAYWVHCCTMKNRGHLFKSAQTRVGGEYQ